MNTDLKIIKNKYGEKMMHLCRELFPTLLEQEGLLSKLLLEHFNEDKFLADDILSQSLEEEFKSYIYGLVDVENNNEIVTIKTPEELLKEAGYTLYECKSEEDIQSFIKYYKAGEELCTFHGGRLNRCHVFFAVKENVLDIKRKDFHNPKRDDLYGTSVISIQFTKDSSHTLSIKNRYNHTVNNPDATFSNNLDNIIPGLTDSFDKYYGMNQTHRQGGFEIDGYVKANNGKYYKYNYEINNVYYCPNNIIIDDFKVKRYPKEQYVILDYFILDLKNKKIDLYDNVLYDSFVDTFGKINNIQVQKDKEIKIITIKIEARKNVEITLDKENRIIGLSNKNVSHIGENFLSYNERLSMLDLPYLEMVGKDFLSYNKELTILDLPNLKIVGNSFLCRNKVLNTLKLPELKFIKNYFLEKNKSLLTLDLPNLEMVWSRFLTFNESINKLNLPKLRSVEDNFLENNKELTILDLPSLEEATDDFFYENETIEILNLPKLRNAGKGFLHKNKNLKIIELPNLEQAKRNFLCENEIIEILNLPKLISVENNFLYSNRELTILELPNLINVGDAFLYCNRALESLHLPKLISAGHSFLKNNKSLTVVNLENLKIAESCFLHENEIITTVNLPKLVKMGRFSFFNKRGGFFNVSIPNIKELEEELSFKGKKDVSDEEFIMIKLVIKEIDKYRYLLEDNKNRQYKINIEFYDIDKLPEVRDIIYINSILLNEVNNGVVSFGKLDGKYGKEIVSEEDKDIIILDIKGEKIYLKRYYG